MTKRILSLVAVLVLLVGIFSACGKKDSGDTDADSTASGLSTADVSLVEDGEAAYTVIRGESCTNKETQAAMTVFRGYKELNVTPKNLTDETEDGGKEIVIGNTNRPETALVKEMLVADAARINDYFIGTVGDKIVIYGMTDDALITAAEYFAANYITADVISGGINYTYKEDADYNTVSIGGESNLALYKIVKPNYNISYLTELEIIELKKALETKVGYKVDSIEDFTVGEFEVTQVPTEATETEIVIGNCMRDGVNTITDYDKYEIRFAGKKVYLNGGSPYATAMAVTEFAKMVSAGDCTFTDASSIEGSYKAVEANYSNKDYYKLTWGDDFDGNTINTKLWMVDWGRETVYGSGIGGKQLNRSTPETTYLLDGKLYICAAQDDKNYYGGLLWTRDTMRYMYGYLEISTLHPKGEGFWTSLWASSNTGASGLYYNETDIEECYGSGTDVKGNTFAWPSTYCKDLLGVSSHTDHKNNNFYAKDGRGFWMDFHTYGFEWWEGGVQFTCDGETYGYQSTLETPGFKEAYSTPIFLRLSMATGFSGNPLGRITDNPDEWRNTNKYIVEYLHIYQKEGQFLTNTMKGWDTN